ncbi:MAG: alpha/beta hydrolase [Candidatus Didemnitutus sp.]|nr:alpha/beta hydrolase [Candidatus Didemnitutus sp.]
MITRPLASLYLLAALIVAFTAPRGVAAAAESRVIPLWPEGVPGALPHAGDEYVQDDRVYNVQVPTLTYFPAPADKAVGTAAIVCPGGGYVRLAVTNEGNGMAKWLNSLGVSVFILKYRLKEYGHPAPLRDMLRAVRLVRSRAAEFGIDPHRIGAFGSSAGGHLVACAGTLYDHPDGKTGAALDAISARPDFLVMQYAVVYTDDATTHRGSREALLGKNPTPQLLDLLSVDRHVTKDTPPAFLVATQEDTSVPLENSIAFYRALRAAGVPAELHLYEKGPHGFGLRAGYGPTSEWPQRAAEWMRSHGWLTPPVGKDPH